MYNDPIRSQCRTCHDSTAVVACATLWTDQIIRIVITTTWIFTRFHWLAPQPLVTRVPGDSSCVVAHTAPQLPTSGQLCEALAQLSDPPPLRPTECVWWPASSLTHCCGQPTTEQHQLAQPGHLQLQVEPHILYRLHIACVLWKIPTRPEQHGQKSCCPMDNMTSEFMLHSSNQKLP